MRLSAVPGTIKGVVIVSVFAGAMLASRGAQALSCVNDVDCPDSTCGGQVCDYSTGTPTCKPAGTGKVGEDGWCGQDSDCKCHAQGATCVVVFCTFTQPPGGAGGATGTGGTTSAGTGGTTSAGTGGTTSAGTGGTTSAGTGGTTSAGTGGTTSAGTGGTTSAGTGGAGGPKASNSSGGCAIAESAPVSALGLSFALTMFVIARARRRRA